MKLDPASSPFSALGSTSKPNPFHAISDDYELVDDLGESILREFAEKSLPSDAKSPQSDFWRNVGIEKAIEMASEANDMWIIHDGFVQPRKKQHNIRQIAKAVLNKAQELSARFQEQGNADEVDYLNDVIDALNRYA
jgi:hypothetical protein